MRVAKMAEKIQVKYEELDQLATRVHQGGDQVEVLFRKMRVKTEQLARSWLGVGSLAFQREMEEEILPGMRRLTSALEATGTAILEISRTFRVAEREAVTFLSGVETLISGDGSAWQNNRLLARDPASLFTDEYMSGLVGSRYQGAGGELRRAMYDLMEAHDDTEADPILHRIAELRGRPYSEIKAEYDKFKLICEERDASGVEPVPDLNTTAHPWFMGSNTQLRSGEVVGDAFGIDPVFGAMLNPTGGIVGLGNLGFPGDDTAVGYHGVVHDAAGYLYTCHEVGPGYDYLGKDERDTGSPFSGHRDGIPYWTQKVGRYNPLNYDAENGMIIFVGGIDLGKKFYEGVKGIF
jgi:WXG100 family type VII secretion target